MHFSIVPRARLRSRPSTVKRYADGRDPAPMADAGKCRLVFRSRSAPGWHGGERVEMDVGSRTKPAETGRPPPCTCPGGCAQLRARDRGDAAVPSPPMSGREGWPGFAFGQPHVTPPRERNPSETAGSPTAGPRHVGATPRMCTHNKAKSRNAARSRGNVRNNSAKEKIYTDPCNKQSVGQVSRWRIVLRWAALKGNKKIGGGTPMPGEQVAAVFTAAACCMAGACKRRARQDRADRGHYWKGQGCDRAKLFQSSGKYGPRQRAPRRGNQAWPETGSSWLEYRQSKGGGAVRRRPECS